MPFIFRLCIVTARASGVAGGHPSALTHLLVQDALAVVGAFIGASNIPERWLKPGSLDLLANSHNLMHVIVVWAAYEMHLAVALDLQWMSQLRQGLITCN